MFQQRQRAIHGCTRSRRLGNHQAVRGDGPGHRASSYWHCLTQADRERLEVRNLSEYFPPRSYGVVVRKGKFLSPQARAFADLVKPGLFERRDYFESGHSER